MKLELADIATNEKKKLQGFKVLGIFPFYLRYIRVDTHIKLCKIREQIREHYKGEVKLEHFHDSELQTKIVPLIIDYCETALNNNRFLSWFIRILLRRKLKACGHFHILNLFITITKLNEPAFFLSYWKLMTMEENTLLREEKQS